MSVGNDAVDPNGSAIPGLLVVTSNGVSDFTEDETLVTAYPGELFVYSWDSEVRAFLPSSLNDGPCLFQREGRLSR